jgi:hypothetical protein
MKRHIPLGGAAGPVAGAFNPLVTVLVRTRTGRYEEVLFCVDTGSYVTSIPIPLAEELDIPFPRDPSSRGQVRGLVGTTSRYSDFVRVRLFGEEFTWPCAFIEVPNPAQTFNYGVIGRIGFLASFNACVVRPFCRIERRRDHLPFWRAVLAYLTPSRLHDFDEPL